MDDPKVYDAAVRRYGANAQMIKAVEECGELIAAVLQWREDRVPDYALAGEIADVEIMCAQLRVILGGHVVDMAKAAKLRRLKKRLGQGGEGKGEKQGQGQRGKTGARAKGQGQRGDGKGMEVVWGR